VIRAVELPQRPHKRGIDLHRAAAEQLANAVADRCVPTLRPAAHCLVGFAPLLHFLLLVELRLLLGASSASSAKMSASLSGGRSGRFGLQVAHRALQAPPMMSIRLYPGAVAVDVGWSDRCRTGFEKINVSALQLIIRPGQRSRAIDDLDLRPRIVGSATVPRRSGPPCPPAWRTNS